jgi:hypothetical protein
MAMGLNDPLARVTDAVQYAALGRSFGLRRRQWSYPEPVYFTVGQSGCRGPRGRVGIPGTLKRVILLGLSLAGCVC